MSISAVDPYKRIVELEKQVCCLKAEEKTVFISDALVLDFNDPITAVVKTGGFEIGVGVTGTYADIAALIIALNTYYSGFGTFVALGANRVKLTTNLFYEDIVFDIAN